MSPKIRAPTGRKASVMLRVAAIFASLVPNSLPMAVSVKTTRKKSKASRVQPRKLASTADCGEPRRMALGVRG